jgi:vesicle-fusing ATPase
MNCEVLQLPSPDLAIDNIVVTKYDYKFIQINNYVFKCLQYPNFKENTVYIGHVYRKFLRTAPKKFVNISEYIPTLTDQENYVTIRIKHISKPETSIKVKKEALMEIILETLNGHILQHKMTFICHIDEYTFLLTITNIDVHLYHNVHNKLIIEEIINDCKDYLIIIDANKSILKNMDPLKAGIGGLSDEFKTIFRRSLALREYSSEEIKKLGVPHVKGVILYGPPGCGKTLIARQLSYMMNCNEPKIINGPEILDKFVGESERKIRELFTDAEADYEKYGDDSKLHVIIFDEIDAICAKRGMSTSGAKDGVVTQMLSKMDGVNPLNNILIIAMTNRLDLLDSALLRPGRFELQLEISLPDKKGRKEILDIHTKSMLENKYLDSKVNISKIAEITRNYTGAELAGLIRNAVSYALGRNYDLKQENKSNIKIIYEDFIVAHNEMKPAFGSNIKASHITNSKKIECQIQLINEIVDVIRNTKNQKIGLYGVIGSGKTFVSHLISQSVNLPYMQIITNFDFIGLTELVKANKLKEIFINSYKCNKNLIILDGIEHILDYSKIQGHVRISTIMLNTIKTLLTCQVSTNTQINQYIILTGNEETFKELELNSYLDSEFNIPLINTSTIKQVVDDIHKNKLDSEQIKEKYGIDY